MLKFNLHKDNTFKTAKRFQKRGERFATENS